MSMDHTNRRILDLLQQDARMSYVDLGRRLDRAESTVRERVTAMERRGVIQSYQARLDPVRIGLHAHAYVRAALDLSRAKEVERGLAAIPEVRRSVLTTGPRPLLIEVAAQDLQDLERTLEERIAVLPLSDLSVDIVVRDIVPERPYRLAPPSWVNARLDDKELVRPALLKSRAPLEQTPNGRDAFVVQPTA